MGVSSRAVAALLDRIAARSIECHSLMVVRHGHVVAEGWWAPYSAERPHLLYSVSKSFTSIRVHGLHLTTEAVAAFGELLLRGGSWGGRQIVPREWVELATAKHVETLPSDYGSGGGDFLCGYGYQFWMARHGYHGNGSFGQECLVAPAHDLVVAVTSGHPNADAPAQAVLDAIWECLLPGLDRDGDTGDDEMLTERLRRLALDGVAGSADPRSCTARIDASAGDPPLPDGTAVVVDPADGGWVLRLGSPPFEVAVGHGEWRESAPLGRPVVAAGAWQGDRFVADLHVITTPHRVRLVIDAATGTASARWSTVPATSPDLAVHLRSPLMTRPERG